MVFSENGIISKANLGKVKYQMSEDRERLDLVLANIKMESMIEGTAIEIDKVKTILEQEEWIVNVEKEDNSLKVTTRAGFLFLISIENESFVIEEQGKDDGEPYPTIKLTQLPGEGEIGETIQIKVEASVKTTDKTTKIETVENVTTGESKEYIEGGVIFEVTTNGEYVFKATTNMGKSIIEKIEVNVSTGGPIDIGIEPTTPRNTLKEGSQNQVATGPITVNIIYGKTFINREDKYQYKIGEKGDWQISKSETITLNVTENTIILARYYNGEESIGLQSYNVQNVDNVAPNSFVPTGTSTTNTIEITAETEDTASEGAAVETAGILRYEYSMDNGTNWQKENVFKDLAQNTEYTIQVKAIDKAGNEKIGTTKVKTQIVPGGNNITFKPSTTSWTNQNITVEIIYENAEGYVKEYSLDNSKWQTYTTAISMETNGTIYARLKDTKGQVGETSQYAVTKIDKQAPSAPKVSITEGTAGNEGWYRSNITVTITNGTDNESGINNSTYTISGGQTTGETSGNSVIITAEGTNTITAYTYDKAGNKSTAASITVKKDSMGPAFTGVETKTVYNTNVSNITDGVSISDSGSGVTSSTGFTYNPQTLSTGENTITYTATDKAGNVTTINRTINVQVMVCFVEGTKVLTPDGLINIEELKARDIVYTYNEETWKIEEKAIEKTSINPAYEITTLTFENGEEIVNTIHHPYYTEEGWKETKDLKVGDKVLTKEGKYTEIIKMETKNEKNAIEVYNLEIKDNHNYFVGETGLLVHNAFLSAPPATTSGGCGLEDYPIE